MKGIYITAQNLSNLDNSSGIVKKIKYQVNAWSKNGIDTIIYDRSKLEDNRFVEKLNIGISYISKSKSTINRLLKKILNEVELNNYDFLYIRKSFIDNYQIELYKEIKRRNSSIKIIMEVPTFPYDHEFKGIKKYLLLGNDKKSRNKLHSVIDRVVTYSDDIEIFGVPTIRISNGVDYKRIFPKKPSIETDIHVIAVALFSQWHGYDRFIEGMKNFYTKKSVKKIILHLVGEGPSLDLYKKMVNKYNLDEYVKIHGKLSGAELDRIYNQCDLALDALARHRSNVYYNSSLKGKEYCAKGIPIISGVKTELDDMENFPYYMRVPADETPIDMYSVLRFHNNIYGENLNKEAVIKDIVSLTKDKFDILNVVNPIVKYLLNK